MHTCCVSWCDQTFLKEANTKGRKYCDLHTTKHCNNRSSRPWLNYKVERFNTGKDICEGCGWQPDQNLSLACRYGLFDVDHEKPELKGTPEGEQPSNYQLLCKNCHAIKTYKEKDYLPKKYR